MAISKVLFVLLLLTVIPVAAQTNQPACCRYPIRTFGAANVNLMPLFSWWQRPVEPHGYSDDSSRPMTAWKRIHGIKTADLGAQWVVDAEIFTNRTHGAKARIILQNPPVQEEQAYNTLKQEVTAYGQQTTNAQKTYQADLKAEQRAQGRAKANAHSWRWRNRLNAENYARQSKQDRNLATKAEDTETQAKQSLTVAEKELALIPSTHGRYQIDYFALETGKTLKGLPVYDLGVIYSPTPFHPAPVTTAGL